jgi:hypothetical protein
MKKSIFASLLVFVLAISSCSSTAGSNSSLSSSLDSSSASSSSLSSDSVSSSISESSLSSSSSTTIIKKKILNVIDFTRSASSYSLAEGDSLTVGKSVVFKCNYKKDLTDNTYLQVNDSYYYFYKSSNDNGLSSSFIMPDEDIVLCIFIAPTVDTASASYTVNYETGDDYHVLGLKSGTQVNQGTNLCVWLADRCISTVSYTTTSGANDKLTSVDTYDYTLPVVDATSITLTITVKKLTAHTITYKGIDEHIDTTHSELPTTGYYTDLIQATVSCVDGYSYKVSFSDENVTPEYGLDNLMQFYMPDSDLTITFTTHKLYTLTFAATEHVKSMKARFNGGEITSAGITGLNGQVNVSFEVDDGYQLDNVTCDGTCPGKYNSNIFRYLVDYESIGSDVVFKPSVSKAYLVKNEMSEGLTFSYFDADRNYYLPNSTVRFVLNLKDGYYLDDSSVSVTTDGGDNVTFSKGNSFYYFMMPYDNVTIKASVLVSKQ